MKFKIGLLISFSALIGVVACTKEKTEPAPPVVISGDCDSNLSYASNIVPILAQNCAFSSCHGNGSTQKGVSLESYDGVVNAINNQKLLDAINRQAGVSPMPASGPLDAELIKTITCWVEDGMPNN
jgi:hypothetical protein